MATIAAELMLHGVFHGCLSIHDVEIVGRPYHRNCGCALHKLKGGRSYQLIALSTAAAKFSSQSCICSGPVSSKDST
ncbi:hypothetical protein BT93_L0766 [Corymbia citriodora subsp. variegata]|uniref:Uncharacterized protein n=1 Tax=Corymbia citriodora subsp. variegata TaxID=360336 RepID=A0A8T0CT42_CORYI|nr:hypothetical protein BT93_L0766 [Corymbia citriodora subsp. variegata]